MALAILATFFLISTAAAQSREPIAVEVTNASEPVLCAEKDNVTLNLASPQVRAFRIEAAHPAYIGTLQRDSFEADWTGCTAPGDPAAGKPEPPRRMTLHEEIDFWIVGLTFQNFWRPATATVRIGNRVEKGLHLLQVWMIRPMGGEEVLVLYPQDGYWRLRPLAPAGMAPTAFGSSFLVGPVEVEGRPIVKLREIAFDPKTRTFTLAFERGGTATVKMAKADQNRNLLEVAFDKPSRAARSRRYAPCTSPTSTTTWPASPCARRAPKAGARAPSWPSSARPRPTCGPAASRPRATTPPPPTWCSAPSRMSERRRQRSRPRLGVPSAHQAGLCALAGCGAEPWPSRST
jgi:hypothetical protein